MAFASTQVALSATAAALYAFPSLPANAQNPPGNTGAVQAGRVDDPIPISLYCAADIYVGGPGVTTGNGYLLKANTSLALQVFGALEVLWAVTADGGAHTAFVLMGRQ